MSFGKRFKRIREDIAKISQQKLSYKVSTAMSDDKALPVRSIRNLENDRNVSIQIRYLKFISDALGVKVQDFYSDNIFKKKGGGEL